MKGGFFAPLVSASNSRVSCAMHGCIVLLLLGASSLCHAQFPGRLQGGHDNEIPTPTQLEHGLGRHDASALAEFEAYKKVVGITAWRGLKATGTISFDNDPASLPVKLDFLKGNRARLDITTPVGHDVTIVSGRRGSRTSAGGKTTSILPAEASVGIVPFYLALEAPIERPDSYSLVDRGTVVSNAKDLHRITLETSLPGRRPLLLDSQTRVTLDAYFDPVTHLLVKTASLIPAPGSPRATLLRIDTYSDYSAVGLQQVPMVITETINGQTVWTMNLTSVDVNALPTQAIFNF